MKENRKGSLRLEKVKEINKPQGNEMQLETFVVYQRRN